MIAIPARLAIVLAVVPLILAAWVFVDWLRDRSQGLGSHASFFRRKAWLDWVVAFAFVVALGDFAGAKHGTNEPPRGASSGRVSAYAEATADKEHVEREEGTNEELTTTEHAETANASTEDGWGRIADRLPQPPVRVAEGASEPSVVELFRLGSVATNGTWDFSAPTDAIVHELWQRRGACDIVELWNYGIAEMRKWEAT